MRTSPNTGRECSPSPPGQEQPLPSPPGRAPARVMQRLQRRTKISKRFSHLEMTCHTDVDPGKKSACSQNLFPTADKELLYAETSPGREDSKHSPRQSQIPTPPRFHSFPKPPSPAQRQSPSERVTPASPNPALLSSQELCTSQNPGMIWLGGC